jgi:hypothetical protein
MESNRSPGRLVVFARALCVPCRYLSYGSVFHISQHGLGLRPRLYRLLVTSGMDLEGTQLACSLSCACKSI